MIASRSAYTAQARPSAWTATARPAAVVTPPRFNGLLTLSSQFQVLLWGWFQGGGGAGSMPCYAFVVAGQPGTGELMQALPIVPTLWPAEIGSQEQNIVYCLEMTPWLGSGESASSISVVVQSVPTSAPQSTPSDASGLLVSSQLVTVAGTWSSGGTPATPGLQTGAVITASSGTLAAGQPLTLNAGQVDQETVLLTSVSGSGPYTCAFVTQKPQTLPLAVATNAAYVTLGNAAPDNAVVGQTYLVTVVLTANSGAIRTPQFPSILCLV